MFAALRKIPLTWWIGISMVVGILIGYLDNAVWTERVVDAVSAAVLDDLHQDDQVDRRAADLRLAGRRHRGPRRRPEAGRPPGAPQHHLLRDRHDGGALHRARRGQPGPAGRRRAADGQRGAGREARGRRRPPSPASSTTPSRPPSSRPPPTTRCCRSSSSRCSSRSALAQVQGEGQGDDARRSASRSPR